MTSIAPLLGGLAPDFDLPCTQGPGTTGRVKLSDYRGRWLALVFYPRDFSLVCPTELTGLGARIEEFRGNGCELLGISCDPVETHEAWIATPRGRGGLGGLAFPLASDEDGSVCRSYGVYLEPQKVALRGLFLLDSNGVVQYQVVHNLSVGRRTEEVLRTLAALQTGGLCAQDWEAGGTTLDPTRALGPGSVVAHYRIETQIGAGSFAAVFRARDTKLQRTVALKVLRPGSPTSPQAMLAEARLAAALNHPNVCTIYAVDDSEGVPVIAMEYLRGRPLEALLAAGALPPALAVDIGRQVAAGMAAAHALGIVHGDLKPQNVIVTDEGPAKVLDFGLSRRGEHHPADLLETVVVTPSDSGVGLYGTPGYMAPEQTRGAPASAACDVFALGVILYEMLTGRRAFPGENILQVLDQIRDVRPGRLASEVPVAFSSLVRRALVRDPAERVLTMAEIAERLPAALQALEVSCGQSVDRFPRTRDLP